MAVHVIPYNPWREQLALTALGNVAGDIIGDMWKTHRQNEQNRKANAFRGQLQQDLQNTAQDNISLMPQKAPAGYNANPWAAAFHQGNNPVAQFDIGTSAIDKTPSLQDIARASDTLAASPRFSMLDPKTVNDIRDNMMRNTIGDMFGNAGDITGQMNALTRGAAMGLVAPQVLAAFGPFGQKMAFPYSFGETDIGKSKVITARNEHTGEITPGLIMPVSVSPDTAATVQGSKDVANIHAGATRDAANINAQGDYARAQATIHAKQLENWQKQYDALKAEIDNDIASLADIKNEKDRAIVQDLIAQKRKRLAQLEQLKAGGYQGGFTGAINDGGQFDDLINTYSQKYNVDPDLIAAIIQVESGGRNGLTSSAGAQGIMQIIPSTQKYLGITDPFNPAQNIEGGIRYFKEMLNKFGGDVEKALRAYNAGPGNVPKGQMPKYKYVEDVMAIYNRRKSARKNNPTQPQKATNVSALRDSQPTAQETPQTTAQQPQTQDRIVMQSKDGTDIYQSKLDEMIREGAKKGLGPVGVKNRLRQKGYVDVPEKRNVTSVAPVLNWSPSYMGGIPQGQALTSAPLPDVQPVKPDSTAPQSTVTALNDTGSHENPDGYTDKNRGNLTPYSHHGNPRQDYYSPWQIEAFFRWLNQYKNNENPWARPDFTYKPHAFPAQIPYPYIGNMAGSLFPSNAYNRMKTDGQYIFLDPRLYGR